MRPSTITTELATTTGRTNQGKDEVPSPSMRNRICNPLHGFAQALRPLARVYITSVLSQKSHFDRTERTRSPPLDSVNGARCSKKATSARKEGGSGHRPLDSKRSSTLRAQQCHHRGSCVWSVSPSKPLPELALSSRGRAILLGNWLTGLKYNKTIRQARS